MDNKFTVIKASDSENKAELKRVYKIALLNESWERQFFSLVNNAANNGYNTINDTPQDVLMKIGLSGVKYVCSLYYIKRENKRLNTYEPETFDEIIAKFQLLDFVFSVLGGITLKNFMVTFPITKNYDGVKWACKDYFFTMDVLSKMEWDKPIGRDNIFDLLWDYENDDLRETCVEYMGVISEVYRLQTGKGIAEQFCEENGIGTYAVDEDTGIVRNNQTGDITKLNKANHLRIVK